VSDTAENRAADIHAMFSDPEVKALVATIGGDHSCHLLPLLDFGHTSPMFTLPVGCRAVIDAGRERFEIVEAAVR
jgi:muramoyltetrapeptide carboxypeptidase LdcA involved in peptidoglycan recycling